MTDSSISSGAEMLRGIFCFKGFDVFFTKAAFCTLRSSVILKTLKEKKNMKKERK